MHSAAKSISEGIGVLHVLRELFAEEGSTFRSVDASAYTGMLRTGVGEVKQRSTKQLWAHGAIKGGGAEAQNVPIAEPSG